MKFIPLLIAMSVPAFSAPNALTADERKEGFKLLFDGKSLDGWRTYKEKAPKDAWKVEDGAIVLTAGGGGDLVTEEQFADFDFRCEWKISKQGNSGIMWRSTEEHQYPWVSGPEYQILDSFKQDGHKYTHETNKGNIAGSFYDIIPGKEEWSKPVGEWNETRILVKGSRIKLFLNGHVTADVDTTTEDFKGLLAKSKFNGWEHFNKAAKGHIVFQDHGDRVEFRSIRIRKL
jgi:hypothetical protein